MNFELIDATAVIEAIISHGILSGGEWQRGGGLGEKEGEASEEKWEGQVGRQAPPPLTIESCHCGVAEKDNCGERSSMVNWAERCNLD